MNDEKYLDWSKLPAFTRELIRAEFQDIEIVIGILWYRYFSLNQENRIGIDQLTEDLDYAKFMYSDEFKYSILYDYVYKEACLNNPHIVCSIMSDKDRVYAINRKKIDILNQVYQQYTNLPAPVVIDHYLITPLTLANGGSLKVLLPQLIEEVNKTFTTHCMNSCALLCRRIFEILLIKAFIANGFENDIIDNDYYFPLGKLINLVNSGHYFKVTKETKQILDKVKELGDMAAHSQFIPIKPKQIEALDHQLDIGIRELLEKANIQINESQEH